MSLSLSVATKAASIDYPSLIATKLINFDKEHITINYVPHSHIDNQDLVSKLVTIESQSYFSQLEILNYLGVSFPKVLLSASESQPWIEFALTKLGNKNYRAIIVDMQFLDNHLQSRSFFVSTEITLADIVVLGMLKSNPITLSILKSDSCVNFSRWFSLMISNKTINSLVNESVKDINNSRKISDENFQKSSKTKKEAHKANFEIPLPNAEMGKVVTRFPPEPSGYLHIGHVKAAMLNEYFAHAYKGKLIIRFDDTNPSKEKVEFEDSIIQDLAFLGIKGDKITHSSDYFDDMFELAVKLIELGNAYCDDTSVTVMREQRMIGEASGRRERSIEENLKIFKEDMKNGTEVGLKNALRAKIDFKASNKALRDPVIYRTNLTPHHRTGTLWKMYPTYDFCVPVVDSIEGVTHSLRTNEYRDRNPQYEWVIQALNLRHVDIWDFGRINFVRTLLSKRKLQWFVDKHYVSGWDDPRFPTIRGVKRRGMTVQGLRNFIMAQGPSKNIINLEWSVLWSLNKKIIDPVAPRFTAINLSNMVEVVLVNVPSEVKVEHKPKHKKNPSIGSKTVIYSNNVLIEQDDAANFTENEEVTFMDWGNVIVKNISKQNNIVTKIEASLNIDGDFRKTSKKITWLANTEDKVLIKLVDFDHLITKDKLEDGDNFEDFITPKTEFCSYAFADLNMKELKEGDIIQFERKGYFRLDVPFTLKEQPVFFTIPDGRVTKSGTKK